MSKTVSIPDFSLVILIGATGSGKSTFARKHFLETEIISSDHCRALVSDDESSQAATGDAFDLLRYMVGIRLKRRLLTVVDATSVRKEDRAVLVKLARDHHALPVAIVLDIDPKICFERNKMRSNRDFGPQVPQKHATLLRRSLRHLGKDGFRQTEVLKSPEQVDELQIERVPLWTDQRTDTGPFDIIGDVHGCFIELTQLLEKLGYVLDPFEPESEDLISARHPEGRTAIFVGDLTDRGPRNIDCLRLVMGMCAEGSAKCVMGNHDYKLVKYLKGKKVQLKHGLEVTAAELENASDEFKAEAREFLYNLRSHLWLANGRLVIAHAGLKEEMHGRGSGAVRSFAMFGETTGEVDAFGLPVRLNWAKEYRGSAEVVFGHTPTPEAEWLNGCICIDTGCVFGGKLTALRWPERELIDVPCLELYAEPSKPFLDNEAGTAQQENDKILYFDDFARKFRIVTNFHMSLVVHERNALAALEVLSRFGVDPRWLMYLPPTMAPVPTSSEAGFLEHPADALDYYARRGIKNVIVEEKHMGSRALLIVCKDADAAATRFGVEDGKAGIVFTRTGRPFFKDETLEANIIARLATAMSKAGLWDELETDWIILDAELMPWSAKAQGLLKEQYFPTASAAQASSKALIDALGKTQSPEVKAQLLPEAERMHSNAVAMYETIEGYCWDTADINDYRIAPFHVLAAENQVHLTQNHQWQMDVAERLAAQDDILTVTKWKCLDPRSTDDQDMVLSWWLEHTQKGGEGFVVKPTDAGQLTSLEGDYEGKFLQPAVKVRGQDYLRIIYGPDYDLPQNLERLRKRGLGKKYGLAEKEFKLGLEALNRLINRKPLTQIHEVIVGILALESEPIDPRL